MPGKLQKYRLLIVLFVILFFVLWLAYLDHKNSKKDFVFAMLDVGQGDALFVESPTGVQLLIDSGPPNKVIQALSKVMSPFDRTIDAIIITNPDQDHIGGFSDILSKYQVGYVLEPGTFNGSKTYEDLKNEIMRRKIPNYLARKGMKLDLGGGAVLEIIFPDRDVSNWDANTGSIIAKLTYGETSIMLTGDSTADTEKYVLDANSKESLDVDVLKVGHHGSRTSTSKNFLLATTPTYALISDGRENKYGHPHIDVVNSLSSLGILTYRTDLLGTIIMRSDGIKETFSFHR